MTETTPLYDILDKPNAIGYFTGASLFPQSVVVLGIAAKETTRTWYVVDTWLGRKAIAPVNAAFPKAVPHEPNFTPKKFQLFLDFMNLYDVPADNGWTEAEIGPQTVEVIDSANGFYKINTWLGERWIKAPSSRNSYALLDLSQIQKVDEKINISTTRNLYKGPTLAAITGNAISPQTVQAFEKIGSWYHIKSDWVGDAWVKMGGVSWSDVDPTKVDEVIHLTKETDFFNTPETTAWGKLAPQQVKAFEKWGNYYHIHAWLGDIWVLVDNNNKAQSPGE